MKKIAFLAAAVVLLAMCTAAQATLIPPGTPSPGLLPAPGTETGTLLSTRTVTESVNIPPTLSATVQESVYRENNALGTLDFVYQFTNNSPTGLTGDVIERATVSNYTGFTVDAYQNPTAPGFATGGVPSTGVSRILAGNPVSINFGSTIPNTGLPPSNVSYAIILRTNARGYTTGTVSVQDSGTLNFKQGFFAPSTNPNAAVPEPTSLLLLGGLSLGLGGAGLRRWRQRKAVSA